MTFYSLFSQVRSTFTFAWVVHIPSQKGSPWTAVYDYGPAQLWCNGLALMSCLASMVCISLRMRQWKVHLVTLISGILNFCQCKTLDIIF